MLYQRGAWPPALPAGRGNKIGASQFSHVSLFLSKTSLPEGANRLCATELRRSIRNKGVATQPACTPVPPVRGGSAAGGARIAPPASALPILASRQLAASGTYPFPRHILNFRKSQLREISPFQPPPRSAWTGFPSASLHCRIRLPSRSGTMPRAKAHRAGPVTSLASGTR